ncbi:MAG: HU family DNA-binding protein, partial [Porphyromonadaceae bacterium]|nr:HU family DNA-binding protein [Porphyromonadaceae bacterium]
MNAKIFLPELIDLLSRKNGCTKKEAEQFLKEFFSLSIQTVSQGENLKINGLGQFRLVWVEPRASVNVHTGEPMEIPGHYKLSYTPDKAMRDAVNAPFSSFIPEVLPDDVPMIEESAQPLESDSDEEKMEETAEGGPAPSEEVEKTVAANIPVAEETATPGTQVSGGAVEKKPEEVAPSVEAVPAQETADATDEEEEEYEYEEPETFTEKMRSHPFVTALCVIVLLVVIVG